MSSPARPSLSEELQSSLFARLGSPQHLEIAGMVRSAHRTLLDANASSALSRLASETPWTVESNLDLVAWPPGPRWVEMPGYIRNLREGENPVIGFLVMPHPEARGLYMVCTAFRTDGLGARHCFAMALLDSEELADNAYRARRFYSRAADESLERIMGMVGVSLSDEFRDELMILEDGREEVVEAVMRDATADIPLLLALLAAEAAPNAFVTVPGEGTMSLVGGPLPVRGSVGRIADRLSRRQSSGLVRFPGRGPGRARLVWYA